MSKSIEGMIECPFYVCEGHCFVTCEGILNGTTITHNFLTDKDKEGYELNVCSRNSGKTCPHHKNINNLYEKGLRG